MNILRNMQSFYEMIMAITLAFVFNVAYSAPVPQCLPPSNLTLWYDQLNADFNVTQFFFPPSLLESQNLIPEEDEAEAYISKNNYGGTECPTTIPSGDDLPLMARSTCPWYITIYHDPTRYPAALPQAVCRCTDCIGSDGTHGCETLIRKIHVLRQAACNDGLYTYVESSETLQVGCTCAKHRVSTEAAPTPSSGSPGEPQPDWKK